MNRRLPNTYPLLLPLSWIYGGMVNFRNFLFDHHLLKSHAFPVPVISVGNITVGGTGKTPHIEYLLSLLGDKFRPAVLSRGYLRKTKEFLISHEGSGVKDIGDEPLQIKRKYPGAIVAVDRDRVHGIKRLLERDEKPGVILLDDAYQHRYVDPGLNILLVDYHRPLSRDYLLPAGRLREPAREKHRAHIVVVTKCPEKLTAMDRRIFLNEMRPFPYQLVFFSTFRYEEPRAVFAGEAPSVSRAGLRKEKTEILLVTGVANSRPLKRHIRGIHSRFIEIKFGDHHTFSPTDIQKIIQTFRKLPHTNKIILTTEKDAMRFREAGLPGEIRKAIYYIPVRVDILFNDSSIFTRQILDYARKNKRNFGLY